MAYACPRCGKPVKRGGSAAAGALGGVAGMLIASAFGSFQCASCGKIATNEFPPEVQTKARMGSVVMVLIALGLIVVVGVVLAVMRS